MPERLLDNRAFVSLLSLAIGLAIFMVLSISAYLLYFFLGELPSVDTLKDYRPSIATRVYADNNELIDEFFLEDRKIINISELP